VVNPHGTLVGRADELDTFRALVTRARNGISGALVVRGDPGIGKTALLDAAAARLPGITLLEAVSASSRRLVRTADRVDQHRGAGRLDRSDRAALPDRAGRGTGRLTLAVMQA
jgi:AAA ATPase domain